MASTVHDQRYLDCSRASLWELVGNPERYPEWWPAVIEVDGRAYDTGDEFVQVTRGPTGKAEMQFLIDERDEPIELRMTCQVSGTFTHWKLADAQGGTFVELESGMEPKGLLYRIFDETGGRIWFRRFVSEALNALERAANSDRSQPAGERPEQADGPR